MGSFSQRSLRRFVPASVVGIVLLLALVSCQVQLQPMVRPLGQADTQVKSAPRSTAVVKTSAQSQDQATKAFTAHLQVQPAHAPVGTVVQVTGGGYAPGASVDLVWYTVDGRYEVQNGTEFVGERFTPRSQVLKTVSADSSGAINTEIQIPSDFGGSHDLRGRVSGQEVSQAGVTIDPTFSMTPQSGPVGTLVELKIVGVDWRSNINTWHILYDNHYLGFMSAVTTRGVATARFRAPGPVGTHQISVWHNSVNTIPYLNFQQGPFKDVPVGNFTFATTSDPGLIAPQIDNFSATDNPWPISGTTTGTLRLSVDRGVVGQTTTLSGSKLPANSNLAIRWWTMVGNRVSATGFSPQSRLLTTVTTGPDGTFTKDLAIPDDLGGQHRVEVVSGDKVLATAGLVIEPSVVSISPTSVKAGDVIQIHLKGVGWTTYDNTYAVTYDNSYIGYVCGFSTNGDVQFTVTATGAPGTHLIDLYPTIYKGTDQQPRIYSVPQITYASDHPQRTTPAIRLSVEIVE